MPSRTLVFAVLLVSCSVALGQSDWPTVRLTAHARIPQILGQSRGFVELYEFDMWLNEAGASQGHVRRCGAPPYEPVSHDGTAPFDVLPGSYAILMHQPEWFARPAVVANIHLQAGMPLDRDVIPGLDYSCACGGNLGPWKTPDGKEPWEWARVFHQTFVARGTSVTHAAYKLAGAKAPSTRLSIHKVDPSRPPEEWEQVGPERISDKNQSLSDHWVGWRSGEIATIPGRTYCLRMEGWPRRDEPGLASVVHRDSLSQGYTAGTAWADGVRQPYDLYGTISSDSDGTTIPYMRIADEKPGKLGGGAAWGQTWIARGKSLAAVDFLVAWSSETKGVTAEAQVRENGPEGKPIGIPKRGEAAWWAPGAGFLGVAWQPGEVPLEPGKTYYVEWRPVAPCKGYNGCVVNHPANVYADGQAFRDSRPVPDADLEMTIVEYTQPVPTRAQPAPYRPAGKNLLMNGGFEVGRPTMTPTELPGWQLWQAAKTTFWYGAYGRDKRRGFRIIGGSINHTAIDGGAVQKVSGLSGSKQYRLSGWVCASAQTDRLYLSAAGYDPTGQTIDSKASTIIWEPAGRSSWRFDQVIVDGIRPKADEVSVWLRGVCKEVGNQTFTVDFDDFVLEETAAPMTKPAP